ncbi:dihydrofolate reductase family protein [Paraburkholderia sp.]|uniref:RibD family protein n=1 Tax=Paraburkholderia sp. TaxID=1926495 RepID=UPI002399CE96|nr:dihydrofolate reductase family protein [Paraburkholderia sp.]MDE1181845.1 dihydrofolate reductase family protein [Paraburkholderia sp.]
MKPYVISHMMSSVDGRSLTDGWHLKFASDVYESTAASFKADGWICGRVTMQEISHGTDYLKGLAKNLPVERTDFFAKRDASQYAISIDPNGRVAWKNNTALDSHIVEVLTRAVPDDYLAYLQSIDVSYVFGGDTDLDLAAVLDTLARELGVKRLIVEGGSHVSGAFVNAGLVDEVSVLIMPLVDGRSAHPSSYEISMDAWKAPTYLQLTSVERADHDAVWMRYTRTSRP